MNLNASSVQQVNHAVEKCVTDIINPFSVQMMPNTLSSLKGETNKMIYTVPHCCERIITINIVTYYWNK